MSWLEIVGVECKSMTRPAPAGHARPGQPHMHPGSKENFGTTVQLLAPPTSQFFATITPNCFIQD